MFYCAWMQFFCEFSKQTIKPSVAYFAKSAWGQIAGSRISFVRGMLLRVVLSRPMALQNKVNLGNSYNPGQNVLGHLRKLGTKTHFPKWTHILPLKKALGCCYKGLFLLSPSPPSSVDCVELKLECITPTLHRGGRGEGRCLNLTSYCVSVPRVLTRVVALHSRWR